MKKKIEKNVSISPSQGTQSENMMENKSPNRERQWQIADGGTSFIPTNETTAIVPTGVYQICYADSRGYYLRLQESILSDELIDLPIPEIKEIVADIEQFWDIRQDFIRYNMTYKRGILVWGPPGNGKSYMMQQIIRNLIARRGVILSLADPNSIDSYIRFIHQFRSVEPERQLAVIFEDFDVIMDSASTSTVSALLNILDGVNQIDGVLYLATTNYPEKLQKRIMNRPSRFDRIYKIGLPNDDVRRVYLQKKIKPQDLKRIDIEDWVQFTKGLSLSHIKELILSVFVFHKKITNVLEHFDEMKKSKTSVNDDKEEGNLGFTIKASIKEPQWEIIEQKDDGSEELEKALKAGEITGRELTQNDLTD